MDDKKVKWGAWQAKCNRQKSFCNFVQAIDPIQVKGDVEIISNLRSNM